MSKVIIANDHGAIEIAQKLVMHLEKRGFDVNHIGVTKKDSVDYPDMASLACGEFFSRWI